MARFEIYRLRGTSTVVLDCQADTVEFGRRVVVPLALVAEVPERIPGLHPIFVVDGVRRVMVTHRLSSVPNREIGTRLGSLRHEADRIMRAIDYLLSGY